MNNPKVTDLAKKFIDSANDLFQYITSQPKFSPTAIKFHYIFNLRDVSRVVEGLLMCKADKYRDNIKGLVQVFAHECRRVFQDRLYEGLDMKY